LSKIELNFGRFFALRNFGGSTPSKIKCPRYHIGHELHHLVKFREVMPTTRKVIDVNTLNSKHNFKCSPLKFLRGPPIGFVVCASKPWSISRACKNFRFLHPL